MVLFTFYGQIHHYTGHWRSRTGRSNKTEIFQFIIWISVFLFANLLKPIWREAFDIAVLDDLVGVHDDRDEQGEHHVDEQTDEEVEVDTAEKKLHEEDNW